MLATAEAMLLGTRLGLSPQLLADIINTSTGRCWASEINNPTPGALAGKASPPADRGYKGGFLSKLMSKGAWRMGRALTHADLQLAAQAAEQVGLKLPSAAIAARVYQKLAESEEFKDLDFSSVQAYIDVASTPLPPSELRTNPLE